MAECLITAGWAGPSCDETFNVPGIEKDKIYVGNKSEITAFTSTVDGEIDGLTFDTYKGLYALTVNKDTASFTEELQVGANSGYYYNETVTFRTIDESTAVRNAIEDMVGTSLVFVLKDKNGKWTVLGETDGVELSEQTKTSGAAPGDDTGDVLTFAGVNRGKAKKFFATDAATTDSTLAGYLL